MSNWRGEPYKQTAPGGHMFAVTSDGCIHDFAYEDDYHNGPYCYACDGDFCQHCETDVYEQVCADVAEIIAEQALFSYEVTGGATIPIGVDENGKHVLECYWCWADVEAVGPRVYSNALPCTVGEQGRHDVLPVQRKWFWDQGGPIR